jgi:hypothetical protein
LADGVKRLFDLQDRPAQPRIRGKDQVPQRLRERPLAAHRNVDRASRHRRDALERGRPCALERGPGRAQAIRISGAPVGAAGKAAVSSASTSGITSTPLARKKLSPSKSHGASMSAPLTLTSRITTPDRSADRLAGFCP